jgi:membrane-associated protein
MEIATVFIILIDFILHIDKHLKCSSPAMAPGCMRCFFLIILSNRRGRHVLGSLLFVVGRHARRIDGARRPWWCCLWRLCYDQCNYTVGRHFRPKVFQWEWFFNKSPSTRRTRFESMAASPSLPRGYAVLRTFVLAVRGGVSEMYPPLSTCWAPRSAGGITTVGYLFGNVPWGQGPPDKIIWAP